MNYWNEIFRLFFPEHCAACGGELPEGMGLLCPRCRIDMPLTYYWKEHDNPVARKFWGLVPVMEASSFFFFVHGSRYRDLVHGFKYRGQWRSCSLLGRSFGERLRESGLYADVELVVPVPLHFRRLFTRGYNQAEYLAEGIASALGVPVERKALARGRYNKSQTRTGSREDRWNNVSGIFTVRNPERLAGRHLLLVDDVLTTGATLVSCVETLQKAVPTCRVSLVTLAVSARELFGRKKGGGL